MLTGNNQTNPKNHREIIIPFQYSILVSAASNNGGKNNFKGNLKQGKFAFGIGSTALYTSDAHFRVRFTENDF